jgi:hypothetical protein
MKAKIATFTQGTVLLLAPIYNAVSSMPDKIRVAFLLRVKKFPF